MKGKSEPIFIDDAGKNVQPFIRDGYSKCSRRVYFIRFSSKKSDGVEDFCKNGEIDLNDIPAAELLTRLTHLNPPDFVSFDIAFTYTGLEKLGVKPELLEVFRKKIPSFYENAFLRASKKLGDTGLSDPTEWADIYRKNSGKGFDLILIAHFGLLASTDPYIPLSQPPAPRATNTALIAEFESRLIKQIFNLKANDTSALALTANWIEESIPLNTRGIYFGYLDGLTSPQYQLKPKDEKTKVNKNIHALGEILLGYPRNDGDNAFADLRLTPKRTANTDPQAIPIDEHYKCFFKDSSFGVLRKIQQRTQVFDKWLDDKAEKMVCGDYEWDQIYPSPPTVTRPYNYPFELPFGLTKEWIKAKLLGRTATGMLLTPTSKTTDLLKSALNQFDKNKEGDFHTASQTGAVADAEGRGCPFSSHIRRMNPREDPVTPFIYRPLLRRGMPYTTASKSFGEAEVGLSGLFICADIAEQFEHLVGVWANGHVLGVKDASNCRDPLIGNHGGDGAAKTRGEFFLNSKAERNPKNQITQFDEPFVVTRGCAYVWFPSVSTLATLTQYLA